MYALPLLPRANLSSRRRRAHESLMGFFAGLAGPQVAVGVAGR
jgi:hypothetical protein